PASGFRPRYGGSESPSGIRSRSSELRSMRRRSAAFPNFTRAVDDEQPSEVRCSHVRRYSSRGTHPCRDCSFRQHEEISQDEKSEAGALTLAGLIQSFRYSRTFSDEVGRINDNLTSPDVGCPDIVS